MTTTNNMENIFLRKQNSNITNAITLNMFENKAVYLLKMLEYPYNPMLKIML